MDLSNDIPIRYAEGRISYLRTNYGHIRFRENGIDEYVYFDRNTLFRNHLNVRKEVTLFTVLTLYDEVECYIVPNDLKEFSDCKYRAVRVWKYYDNSLNSDDFEQSASVTRVHFGNAKISWMTDFAFTFVKLGYIRTCDQKSSNDNCKENGNDSLTFFKVSGSEYRRDFIEDLSVGDFIHYAAAAAVRSSPDTENRVDDENNAKPEAEDASGDCSDGNVAVKDKAATTSESTENRSNECITSADSMKDSYKYFTSLRLWRNGWRSKDRCVAYKALAKIEMFTAEGAILSCEDIKIILYWEDLILKEHVVEHFVLDLGSYIWCVVVDFPSKVSSKMRQWAVIQIVVSDPDVDSSIVPEELRQMQDIPKDSGVIRIPNNVALEVLEGGHELRENDPKIAGNPNRLPTDVEKFLMGVEDEDNDDEEEIVEVFVNGKADCVDKNNDTVNNIAKQAVEDDPTQVKIVHVSNKLERNDENGNKEEEEAFWIDCGTGSFEPQQKKVCTDQGIGNKGPGSNRGNDFRRGRRHRNRRNYDRAGYPRRHQRGNDLMRPKFTTF